MSLGAYLIGVGSAAIVVLAATLAGRLIAQRLLPSATGALAGMATAVGGVTVLLVTAEVLGSIGLLRRWALVVVAVVVGAGCELRRRSRRSPASASDVATPRRRGTSTTPWALSMAGVIAAGCVAILAAQALLAIHDSAVTGIFQIDAVEYHLTTAAHFASTHHTTSYLHVSFGDDVPYYPFNAELLNAIGMVTLGRDSLSLLIGTADIGLMLLAAYAIGDEYDTGPLAICAVTPLIAVLGSVDAGALNDWASIWPFIAGVAFTVHGWRREGGVTLRIAALSGLGFGLAAGTKLDLLAPAVVAGLALVVLAQRRLRALGVVASAGLIGGGYWYLRNIILVGSPVPSSYIPGLPRVPMSLLHKIGYTVAHYLTDGHIWTAYFRPGLHEFFGPAWVPVLSAAAIGLVIAFRPRGEAVLRVFSVVAILSVVAYAVTPSSALGLRDMPGGFTVNLRYLLPPAVLGVLLLAVTFRARRLTAVVALGFLAALIITVTSSRTWSSPEHRPRLIAVAIAMVVAGVCLQPIVARHARQVIVVVGLGAVIAGYPIQQQYLRHRYAPTATPVQALVHALPAPAGLHIGVVGRTVEYPFFGPQWRNTVTYVGQPLANHAYELYTDCAAWRAATGKYDLVVVAALGAYSAPAYRWTSTDPDAHVVFKNSAGTIFALSHGFASQPCAGGNHHVS